MQNRRKVLNLWALGLAIFVVVLDGTIMNIAMKAIIQDLNTTAETIQAMITIYSLVMASVTLIGARLGDKYGRKNIFLVGVTLFGIGALIATFAQSSTMLLIGWSVIEGIGAALMVPTTLSLMASDFTGKDRALAFGLWGGISAVGAALGPILGGFLTTHFSWRLAFAVELIPILIILPLSVFIKDSKSYISKKKMDYLGSFLSATALLLMVHGLLNANTYGWLKPITNNGFLNISYTFWELSVGLLLLILFFKHELKCVKNKNCLALIEPTIFRNRQFSLSIVIALIVSMAQAGALFVLPLFLLVYRQFDAMSISLTLIPLMFAVFITSTIGARFNKHKKLVVILGLLITTLSAFVLKGAIMQDTRLIDMVPGLFLLGIGIGLIMAQLTNITISAVNIARAGEASGINSTIRWLGGSLGTAIMGTILFGALNHRLIVNIDKSYLIPYKVKTKLVHEIQQNQDIQLVKKFNGKDNINKEIKKAFDDSFVYATLETLNITVYALAIALVSAIALPSDKIMNKND